MDELKKCPFCGSGEAELQVVVDEPWSYVRCHTCNAQGKTCFDADYNFNRLHGYAIKAWNQRDEQ